ncbi:MAG: LamG-like jellyroll fold domain-containing protein [Planctomycetota bacterium]
MRQTPHNKTLDLKSAAKGHPASGLTLAELLVVLTLIAMISGLAVGMIRRGDGGLGSEADAKLLRSAIRLARNTARRGGTGAQVVVDPKERQIEIAEVIPGGVWHFEDDTGARGARILIEGDLVENGRLGGALKVSGGVTELGEFAWQQPTNGFRFRVWIAPTQPGSVVSREGNFSLNLDDEGALRADLFLGLQGENVSIETRKGVIPFGAWSLCELSYDRSSFEIRVNGVRYARKLRRDPVKRDDTGALRIGGNGFQGLVDEARYDLAGPSNYQALGGNTLIDSKERIILHFDGRGRLDARFHRAAVVVVLRPDDDDPESPVETVRVELSGAIR